MRTITFNIRDMRINTQRGIAPLALFIIALLVLGGGAYGIKKVVIAKKERGEKEKQEQTEKAAKDAEEGEYGVATTTAPSAIHLKLDEQNKSGQKGEVTITQIGTSTVKVIVSITGKPSGVAQPAHIHLGACPNVGAVKYPLTSVEKGASQTEIPNLTLAQLLSELPLAVNVHKSAAEIKVYTSCGDIEKKKTSSNQGAAAITAMPTEITVTYSATGFSPKTVTIKKGDTVVFENRTGKKASVASNDHPTHLLYPEFDQYKTDQRGKTEFRFTFEKAGAWNYHDHLAPTMTGTVIVTE